MLCLELPLKELPNFFHLGTWLGVPCYSYRRAANAYNRADYVVEKLRLELRAFALESGTLPACQFPAGTLISYRAVYLFVHNFVPLQ